MRGAYIREFRNYADALNGLQFELRVPEYYDPILSEYFKTPRKRPNPIVNGEEVSWDEYNEKYPDNEDNHMRDTFVPTMIYKAEDLNMCYALRNIPEIIDMCDNNVPFDIVNPGDVAWIIELMDGYATEMMPYEEGVPELKDFLTRMHSARLKLVKLQEEIAVVERHLFPGSSRPRSIGDFLSAFVKAKE